jgi:hypothetical protein
MRPFATMLLLVSGGTVPAMAACGTGQDAPPVTFHRAEIRTGGTPYGLSAADLDSDGDVDLVMVDQEGGRIVVLEGDGGGEFAVAGAAAAGASPSGGAVADFDGDGHLDVAVANHETDYVTVLLGAGDGTFPAERASRLPVAVEPHPHAVGSGDVNRDGYPDLLVDDRDRAGLALWLGGGDGTFRSAGTIGMGGDPYRGFLVEDVDRDGLPDLATPNESEIGLRRGRRDGTFGELERVDTSPVAPFGVAAGDMNGDGITDLVATSGEGSAVVQLLHGRPDGGFAPATGTAQSAGSGATSVDVADLDGDGAGDAVIAAWDARDLTILPGGDRLATPFTVESGANPWAVLTADLDGDGVPDIAAANYGAGTVTVLLTRRPGQSGSTGR